jgi:hypothetical protein
VSAIIQLPEQMVDPVRDNLLRFSSAMNKMLAQARVIFQTLNINIKRKFSDVFQSKQKPEKILEIQNMRLTLLFDCLE